LIIIYGAKLTNFDNLQIIRSLQKVSNYCFSILIKYFLKDRIQKTAS